MSQFPANIDLSNLDGTTGFRLSGVDPADHSGIVMLWNSNRHVAARLQLEFFDMLYGLAPTDWLELPDKPLTR